jgi:hypothetical protein
MEKCRYEKKNSGTDIKKTPQKTINLGSMRVKSAFPMVWKGFIVPTLARTFLAPLFNSQTLLSQINRLNNLPP